MQIELKDLSFIIPIFTFFGGMLIQDYRIKKSNIREKAKEIDEKILKVLKTMIVEPQKCIENESYIRLSEKRATSVLDEKHFIDPLINSGVFKVEHENVRVVYKKDKFFNEHAEKIVQYLNEYKTEVNSLGKIVESLSIKDLPPNFEDSVRGLLKNEFGNDCLDAGILDRREEFLFVLFAVAVCNSKNSYENGRDCIRQIVKRRFKDLGRPFLSG